MFEKLLCRVHVIKKKRKENKFNLVSEFYCNAQNPHPLETTSFFLSFIKTSELSSKSCSYFFLFSKTISVAIVQWLMRFTDFQWFWKTFQKQNRLRLFFYFSNGFEKLRKVKISTLCWKINKNQATRGAPFVCVSPTFHSQWMLIFLPHKCFSIVALHSISTRLEIFYTVWKISTVAKWGFKLY